MQALRPDGAIVGEWLIDPLARGENPVQLIEKDGPFDAMPEAMPGSWLCGLAENCCGAIWSNDPRIAYEKDRVQPLSVRGAFNPADLTLPWSVIRSASRRYLVIHVRELQYRGVSVHLEDEDNCRLVDCRERDAETGFPRRSSSRRKGRGIIVKFISREPR